MDDWYDRDDEDAQRALDAAHIELKQDEAGDWYAEVFDCHPRLGGDWQFTTESFPTKEAARRDALVGVEEGRIGGPGEIVLFVIDDLLLADAPDSPLP